MSKLAKSLLMIKKTGMSVLSSDLVGGVIRKVYRNRIPHNSRIIYTDSNIISNKIVGNIFFRSYESSEIKFTKKYMFTNLPVVELGASLGVMTMQIAKITTDNIYSIEANPELIPIINRNLEKNKVHTSKVFNYIIATSKERFYFLKGDDNTAGYITTTQTGNAVHVKSISLTDFLSENEIVDYILVCDIEGAEIYILKEDINALKNCKQIIIELHDTRYNGQHVGVDEMVKLCVDAGFVVVESYGVNMVFERKIDKDRSTHA